jgi:hypothetical protein
VEEPPPIMELPEPWASSSAAAPTAHAAASEAAASFYAEGPPTGNGLAAVPVGIASGPSAARAELGVTDGVARTSTCPRRGDPSGGEAGAARARACGRPSRTGRPSKWPSAKGEGRPMSAAPCSDSTGDDLFYLTLI